MTLATTVNRVKYTGNDSTDTYSYAFKIFDEDDLVVIIRNTSTGTKYTLVKTTDYTVAGIGTSAGGDITLVNSGAAWAGTGTNLDSGHVLYILRVCDLTQDTDIRNTGAFYPETHEDKFDYLTMVVQQLQDQINRVPLLPQDYSPADFTNDLGDPTADYGVVVNATGDGFDFAELAPAGPTGPQGPQGDPGADGSDGLGVPAGGTTGQVLEKASNADNDTQWATPSGSGLGTKEVLSVSNASGKGSTNLYTPYYGTVDSDTSSANFTYTNTSTSGLVITASKDIWVYAWVWCAATSSWASHWVRNSDDLTAFLTGETKTNIVSSYGGTASGFASHYAACFLPSGQTFAQKISGTIATGTTWTCYIETFG